MRKPLYENEMCKLEGLRATCNNCDRIIFEDENYLNEYIESGGYCRQCNEESDKKRVTIRDKDWTDTHFQIVAEITQKHPNSNGLIKRTFGNDGRCGLWDLAEQLTDEFQTIHKEEKWIKKDYYETLNEFLNSKKL